MKKTFSAVVRAAFIIVAIVAAGCSRAGDPEQKNESVRSAEQPLEIMTVSPGLLYGKWSGKDSLGRSYSFSFSEPPEGRPEILRVSIRSGRKNVSGICSFWENNMCDLKLETKELQNIRSRWFFKYDGTFLTIQLGDGQRLAESNAFTLKKD
ncbi:MAG: hypothetical protein JW699_08120 [Chitinispirillaceae bacterium]|nr:hypothetical protein [Chitinispirillaceae bacterium]